MPLRRVWIGSPNYSSRSAGVRLVVVHTAEGARTYQSLGSFFQGRVSASSHVGIDDTAGTIGEYVRRSNSAWTQAAFNSQAVAVELCAFAKWDRAEWNRHPNMLRNCASWIAEECAAFGIPIVKLSSAQAQGSGRGVCGHVELGARGGGHWDPGPGFPWADVIAMAKGGSGGTTAPPPEPKEGDLVAAAMAANGTLHVFELHDGWIWYSYQPHGQTGWNGGKAGKGPAGMSRFAPAADVVSISAAQNDGGVLHVFGRKKDGSLVYTYQPKGKSSWNGGQAGKSVAGLSAFAPKP
jgi:hypothetical protein